MNEEFNMLTRSKRKEIESSMRKGNIFHDIIIKYTSDIIESDEDYVPESPDSCHSRKNSISSASDVSKDEIENLVSEAESFIYGTNSPNDIPFINEVIKIKQEPICDSGIQAYLKRRNNRFTKNLDNYDKEYIKLFDEVIEDEFNENINYFFSLDEDMKKKIIAMEEKIKKESCGEIPLRFKILNMPISVSMKSLILRRLDALTLLENSSNEYHKLSEWINTIKNVPFNIYHELSITKKNETKDIENYLIDVKKRLDESVYGHIEAKTQILQIIAKWISNPECKGNIIALKGPMGNGKTTLVKEGICRALKRPFAFLPLGGAKDSSFFEGHSYTYEGSECGRIVKILIESKCMNPVFYFDELDKVSENPKGNEIINKLIHITDHSQNSAFNDVYFSGIDFDISRALYIFSFNDESKLNPILKDRMHIIEMKKLDIEQKHIIAKDYLIPQICKDIGFNKNDIIIKRNVIDYMINNYTDEDGVRELKRCLENVISRINILKFTNNSQKLGMSFNISEFQLPLELKIDLLKKIVTSGSTPSYNMFYT